MRCPQRLNYELMNHLKDKQRVRLGIISDTHGHLGTDVMRVFDNIDAIIHAGDVGGPKILDELEKIAPIIAVRGNMDGGRWASNLPGFEIVEAGRKMLYVLHDSNQLDLDPVAAGISVIITGHTHRPSIKEKHGVLYVNPGSASMPRYNYAPSVALLSIADQKLAAQIVLLDNQA